MSSISHPKRIYSQKLNDQSKRKSQNVISRKAATINGLQTHSLSDFTFRCQKKKEQQL